MPSFTLIELLIVVAIIMIIGSITAVLPTVLQPVSNLNGASESGISTLLEARARTLASQAGSQFGVHFEQAKMVLFLGAAYDPLSASNKAVALPSGIIIASIALQGGGSDVVFKRLTGATDQYGTVTFHVATSPGRTRAITILASGLIRQGPTYFEDILPSPMCRWAVFGDESISMSEGNLIDSYNSGGGGSDNQANAQTNSIASGSVTMGLNNTINGTFTVGPGGNPSQVISMGAGSTITGGTASAFAIVNLPPPVPANTPPGVAPINPPLTTGAPLVVPGGSTMVVDVCASVPSSITTGNSVSLTLQGDCPLNLSQLSIGGGNTLHITGDIGTLNAGNISIGNSVITTFDHGVAVRAKSITVAGGSPITVQGNGSFIAESFNVGNSDALTIQGNATFTADSFSLAGGDSLISEGDMTITTQPFSIGNGNTLQANGKASLRVASFSTGGGNTITAGQDLSVRSAGGFSLGNSNTIRAGNAMTILADHANLSGGNSLKSATDLPNKSQFVLSGSASFTFGNGNSFTGTLYAPTSDISMSGGNNVTGQVIGGNLSLGNTNHIKYDLALSGQSCLQ